MKSLTAAILSHAITTSCMYDECTRIPVIRTIRLERNNSSFIYIFKARLVRIAAWLAS